MQMERLKMFNFYQRPDSHVHVNVTLTRYVLENGA